MNEYNLYSEFNADKRKETYTHYLEVIIDADGKIMYAVPSHQEKMIQMCCEKLNYTREQLNAMCPQEYYFDFMTWLSMICGAVAVWEKMTMGYGYAKAQIESLKMLKSKGLYLGEIKED